MLTGVLPLQTRLSLWRYGSPSAYCLQRQDGLSPTLHSRSTLWPPPNAPRVPRRASVSSLSFPHAEGMRLQEEAGAQHPMLERFEDGVVWHALWKVSPVVACILRFLIVCSFSSFVDFFGVVSIAAAKFATWTENARLAIKFASS